MPRADAGYPHNFEVDSEIFKKDEPETEVKINNLHRVSSLLFGSPFLACTGSPLFAHYTHTHTHARTEM